MEKLAGAVALGFTGAKDSIAGIRPIEEMLAVQPETAAPRQLAALPKRSAFMTGGSRLGKSRHLFPSPGSAAPPWNISRRNSAPLGLEPLQGTSGGGSIPDRMGKREGSGAGFHDQRPASLR